MIQREQKADQRHQEDVVVLEAATQLARANAEAAAQAMREAQAKAAGMRDSSNRES